MSFYPESLNAEDDAAPALRVRAPLLPAVLAIAAILPGGLNIRPGGVLLTAPRLVLLAAVPVILLRLIQRRAGAPFRFCLCDAVVLAAGAWMFIAISMTQGISRAAVGAGVMILELCGGYFLMRTCLTRPGEAAAVARVLAIGIAIDGCLSVLDVIAHRPVLLQLADSLTGYAQVWQQDYRHGMMRALGMQEHPIMLGTLCVFGAVIALSMLRGRQRVVVLLGCLVGLVTSDSSGPIMGFILACGLLLYRWVTPGMTARWRVLMAASGSLFGLFVLIHPTPFSWIVSHTSSSAQDGFYRLLEWNLIGPVVLANPVFGLGLESGVAEALGINNTIDSFWLNTALEFGIVGSALFGFVLLTSCGKPLRRAGGMRDEDAGLGLALGIIVFEYFMIGLTVHFWGTCWILIGVTAGMRAHLGELSAAEEASEEEADTAALESDSWAGHGNVRSI